PRTPKASRDIALIGRLSFWRSPDTGTPAPMAPKDSRSCRNDHELGGSIVDPKGKIAVFHELFASIGYYDVRDPCDEHIIGDISGSKGFDFHSNVDISPTADLLAYTGAGTNRGFTWVEPVIIDTANDSTEATLGGHLEETLAIEFSEDGASILTLTASGVLRLWSVDPYVDEDLVRAHRGCILAKTCPPAPSDEERIAGTWS